MSQNSWLSRFVLSGRAFLTISALTVLASTGAIWAQLSVPRAVDLPSLASGIGFFLITPSILVFSVGLYTFDLRSKFRTQKLMEKIEELIGQPADEIQEINSL